MSSSPDVVGVHKRPPLALPTRLRLALRCVVDAFIPSIERHSSQSGYWMRSASDLNIEEHILSAVAAMPVAQRRAFVLLLILLASPLAGLLSVARFGSILALSPSQREHLLMRWSCSRFGLLRRAFASLKRLTCFMTYSVCVDEVNPNWSAIGYPGPPQRRTAPRSPNFLSCGSPKQSLEADVLVIGSGAGGGVVAGELSARGYDVLVLDKGPDPKALEHTDREHEMISQLYEGQGLLTNHDDGISLFAGSCLGGGTTVNWSVSLRPPEDLLQEWATAADLPHLLSRDFQESIDSVCRAVHVRDCDSHNFPNRALLEGACAAGFNAYPMPQNKVGCEQHNYELCGYCLFGCRDGNKQAVIETFLPAARFRGARVFAGTEVTRLRRNGSVVTGADAIFKDESGSHRISIRAKRIVLAAGALHTPALLMRSGFSHPQIGRNFYIHPTILVLGRYADPVNSWHGGMMTGCCDEFASQDGLPYGCRIETAPLHSGLLAAVLPWASGEHHKQTMLQAAHYAAFIVLTRDRFGGRVTLDRDGGPKVHYQLHAQDRRNAMRGMALAASIHAGARAKQVLLTHNSAISFNPAELGMSVAAYEPRIAALRWRANDLPLFSAHLMGTCRMGGNASKSPVRPDGRLVGMKNLYVADSSVFPSSSGVNPMITIQSLAHHTAQRIASESSQ